jgi:hypothetical protein
MEHDPRTPDRTRENVVIFTLVLFLGGIALFFLDVISLGIVSYALGSVLAFALLGCLHYLLWGHAMNQSVAAEREAMLREEAKESAGGDKEAIQDLSRRRGIKRGRPGN